MLLPASFAEISYFDNEYRGDLVVTEGVLYYFPTELAAQGKIYLFGGLPDAIINVLASSLMLFFGGANLKDLADGVAKIWQFLRRSTRQISQPRIKKLGLWQENDTNQILQHKLDNYLHRLKATPSDFAGLPKPMRFALADVKHATWGWRFKFETEFDTHDFGVNVFYRKRLQAALKSGGFLQ